MRLNHMMRKICSNPKKFEREVKEMRGEEAGAVDPSICSCFASDLSGNRPAILSDNPMEEGDLLRVRRVKRSACLATRGRRWAQRTPSSRLSVGQKSILPATSLMTS